MDRRRFLILTSQGAALSLALPPLTGCARGAEREAALEAELADVPYVVDERRLVFDAVGAAYALDATGHRVLRLDDAGASLGAFGRLGDDAGELNHPVDGAVGPDGTLYLIDRGNHRVVHYDAAGQLLATFGDDALHHPSDLTIHDGVVFVCDARNHRVVRFGLDGEQLDVLGGGDDSLLNGPRGVACAGDVVFVVDAGDASVAALLGGELIERIGGYGEEPGRFLMPVSIAASPDGRLFVGDVATGFVTVFEDGSRLVGRFRPRDDSKALVAPSQLHVTPDGTLHVATAGHVMHQG